MIGLVDGWSSLPRVTLREETTSASGAPRTELLEAIPLLSALANPVTARVIVHAGDGMMLALSAEDTARAMLAEGTGGWQLILSGDRTRRRRIKNPIGFEVE